YFARTKWTIGLVSMNIADLQKNGRGELTEDGRSALEAALQISQDRILYQYGNAGDRLNLEVLKLRVLRKLAESGSGSDRKESLFKDALTWGEAVLNRPGMRDHPLI